MNLVNLNTAEIFKMGKINSAIYRIDLKPTAMSISKE